MFLIGKNKEVWQLDESLREIANKLVEKHPGKVGHVLTPHVVFVRCIAAMQKDWLGKCWYIRPPLNGIVYYAMSMAMKGHYDEEFAQGMYDKGDGNVNYVIAVSDDAVRMTADPDKVTEATILHEMMHIRQDMDGIEKHNIMDFKEIIDTYGTSYTQGYFKQGMIEESN